MNRIVKHILSFATGLCMMSSVFAQNTVLITSTSGTTVPTQYTNLTTAFTAINNGTHQGSITVSVFADMTLSTTATLNASGSGSANYSSVSVTPSGNRTITSSYNAATISLNGADYVTIDGLNSSGNSLTIKNTYTTAGYGRVFDITNGAANNKIKNCTLLASCYSYGVITFNNSTSNNDNDSIAGCTIGTADASYRPLLIVYAPTYSLFTGHCTDNIVLYNNNMYDFGMNATTYAIAIGTNHNNWKVYNNRFYQTATVDYSASVVHYILYYDNNISTVDIRNNVIGGNNSSNTGTYTLTTTSSGQPIFRGFYIANASLSSTSNIQGNVFKNISLTTYSNSGLFLGIYIGSGMVDVGNISGNTIGSTSSTGSITIDSKYNSGSVTFYGIYTPSAYVSNISNNSIGGVNFGYSGSGANSMYFYGVLYYYAGGPVTVSGNTIGSSGTSNSIRMGPSSGSGSGNYYFFGLYTYLSAANTAYVQNNTIANVFINCSGTASYTYAIFNYAGVSAYFYVDNNIVKNISTYSTLANTFSLIGVYLYTTGSGSTIKSNQISSLYNTNTSPNTWVTGIYQYSSGGATDVKYNQLKDLACYSTGDARVYGIYGNSGTLNITNNLIHINNNYTSQVIGIDLSAGSAHTVYYNTILIEGSNALTGATACMRRGNISMTVQNNIFYNKRTSSGSNYSFFNNTSVFTNATINYNLHIVPSVSSCIYHNGAARSWATYIATNTTDKWSWCETNANVPASTFFTNTATSDLSINTASQLCWYANGKGAPVSTVDDDINASSGDRATSAVNGATDIGAYEFVTSTTPPAATHSGTLTAGSTSTYTFGNKTVGTIVWQSGYTPPSTAPTFLYYSGVNPPYPIPGAAYFNSYWRITASPSSGYSYVLKLYYSDAVFGNVTSTSNLRIARNGGSSSATWGCACNTSGANSTTVDATNRTIANVTPYTGFSFFTGTDMPTPLPVTLLTFDARRMSDYISLNWATASEMNSAWFDVQRSYNGEDFETITREPAAGNSNSPTNYNYNDHNADLNAGIIYYRLKQTDHDGSFTYSPIAVVQKGGAAAVTVLPNPFNHELTLHATVDADDEVMAELYNTIGNLVWSQKLPLHKGENNMALPVGSLLNKGTYILKLNGRLVQFTKKVAHN